MHAIEKEKERKLSLGIALPLKQLLSALDFVFFLFIFSIPSETNV